MYLFRISANRSLSFAVSSLVRFGIKSRSISTDNLGRLKTVRFIAVPPLSSRCSHIYSCVFRNSRIVLKRRTFSNVSRLKPYSRALASSSLLLYCGILYPPFFIRLIFFGYTSFHSLEYPGSHIPFVRYRFEFPLLSLHIFMKSSLMPSSV